MIIPDMSSHPLFAEEKWSGSIVGLPLKVGPRVVGVFTVARNPAREFIAEELHTIQSFADQAAMDIENARIDSLASEQIRIDTSTGLHNRRSLDEHLEFEAIHATQGQYPFAFFMLQLEGYEEINQRYGHSAGDFVLAETATAIAKELRKSDFLARYDAARWGLVLSRSDRTTALSIAERIEDIISRRRFSLPEKGSRKVTLTIGIAIFPDDGITPAELIRSAQAALDGADENPGSIQFASQPTEGGDQHPTP
jgi:diguanylate cyclase (GGDEF)-like protein